MTYYNAKVKVTTEDDRGKLKTRSELYLVDALSVTEAEAKVYKDFEGFTDDWEVVSVAQTKVVKVIE